MNYRIEIATTLCLIFIASDSIAQPTPCWTEENRQGALARMKSTQKIFNHEAAKCHLPLGAEVGLNGKADEDLEARLDAQGNINYYKWNEQSQSWNEVELDKENTDGQLGAGRNVAACLSEAKSKFAKNMATAKTGLDMVDELGCDYKYAWEYVSNGLWLLRVTDYRLAYSAFRDMDNSLVERMRERAQENEEALALNPQLLAEWINLFFSNNDSRDIKENLAGSPNVDDNSSIISPLEKSNGRESLSTESSNNEIPGLISVDQTEEGLTTLRIDTNGDGKEDMIVKMHPGGRLEYIPIEQFVLMNMSASDVSIIDSNKDGYYNQIVIQDANGNKHVAADTDGDGRIDQYHKYDKNGKTIESEQLVMIGTDGKTVKNDSPSLTNELEYLLSLKNQPMKLGQDGHLTFIGEYGELLSNENKPLLFYLNGINTTNEDAISTGQDIRNLTGSAVSVIYNESTGLINDLFETSNLNHPLNNQLSPNMQSALQVVAVEQFVQRLESGKDIRIIAHSQGAAQFEAVLPLIEKRLEQNGKSGTLMQNVTLITMGGYSSKAENWPKSINVIAINNNDPIPALQGWFNNYPDMKMSNHPVRNYYPMIQLLANPNVNLSPLYGNSYNANEWDLIRMILGQ